MIAATAAMISVATTAVIAGASLYAGANEQPTFVCGGFGCSQAPPDSGARAGGVALMVIGVAAMGAGIPLLAIGAQKVPDRDEARVLVPNVRIGAGSAALRWAF
jgi:hypothetical protein